MNQMHSNASGSVKLLTKTTREVKIARSMLASRLVMIWYKEAKYSTDSNHSEWDENG